MTIYIAIATHPHDTEKVYDLHTTQLMDDELWMQFNWCFFFYFQRGNISDSISPDCMITPILNAKQKQSAQKLINLIKNGNKKRRAKIFSYLNWNEKLAHHSITLSLQSVVARKLIMGRKQKLFYDLQWCSFERWATW